MYVGYSIEIKEALRLLRLDESYAPSYYETEKIQAYLTKRGSCLVFQYIDKGACLFGVRCGNEPYGSVTNTLKQILDAKILFEDELKQHQIDTSVVYTTWIEEESVLRVNPEPWVITV